jgi:hypothetical protein
MKIKIYKISNSVNNKIYVGSTDITLQEILTIHKIYADNNEYKHRKLYKFMNEIGVEKFKIELLEEFEFIDRDYRSKLCNNYLKKLNPELNSVLATDKCDLHDKKRCSICKTSKCFCIHNRVKHICRECNPDKFHCEICNMNHLLSVTVV